VADQDCCAVASIGANEWVDISDISAIGSKKYGFLTTLCSILKKASFKTAFIFDKLLSRREIQREMRGQQWSASLAAAASDWNWVRWACSTRPT